MSSHIIYAWTQTATQKHTHTNTPVHTLAFHLRGLSISRMPPTCTHMSPTHTHEHMHRYTRTCRRRKHTFHCHGYCEADPVSMAMETGSVAGCRSLGHTHFLLMGGVTRWEVRQKDADRGMTWWDSWRDKYQGMRDNDVKNDGMEGWKRNERALKIGREEVGCKDSWTPWGGIKV